MPTEIYFPYDSMREGQREIVDRLLKELREGVHIVFEAPTGLGKTIAVLSVVVPYAKEHGLKVLYACRTHTQMSRVIEELRAMRAKGYPVRGAMLRGKAELCLIESLRRMSYRAMIRLCQQLRERGRCPYDVNFRALVKERGRIPVTGDVMHTDDIIELAKSLEVCPHELALNIAREADVIALSYLYLVDRDLRHALCSALDIGVGDAIVIFDEAHNVIDVALEAQSAEVSIRFLEEVAETIRRIKVGQRVRAYDVRQELSRMKYAIVRGIRVMMSVLREKASRLTDGEMHYPAKEFVSDFEIKAGEGMLVFLDFLERFLDELSERGRLRFGEMMIIGQLREFLELLIDTTYDERYVHVLSSREGTIKYAVSCIDPQLAVRPVLEMAHATIHMSATLSPLEHYMKLVGIGPDAVTFKVRPSYAGRLRIYIVRGVTTAYEERSDEMYRRIARLVGMIADNVDANVAVFFPSYEVLEEVRARLETRKRVFVEQRGESTAAFEARIREFKSMWRVGGALLLGVMGGRACEGVDYPGRQLEVEVIVGVPFPEPGVRLYAQRKYLASKYGDEEAFKLTAVIPAMRKVNQALGRLVRSPKDYGIAILADTRYERLREYIVDWAVIEGVREYEEMDRLLEEIRAKLEGFRRSS